MRYNLSKYYNQRLTFAAASLKCHFAIGTKSLKAIRNVKQSNMIEEKKNI